MADLPLVTLARIVTALDDLKLPFAIIGGVAVSIRSSPRYTEDVDAVLWVREDDWSSIIDGLRARGFQARAQDPLGFARGNRLLILLDSDGVKVDLSFGALPLEENIVSTAERIMIGDGLTAPIVTSENLVVMKAIAWRPKDVQDIRDIVSINVDLDRRYVMDTFEPFAEILEVPERVPELLALLEGTPER